MTNGANSVHEELKKELLQYIKSQYLSKSPVLHDAIGKALEEEGVLFRQPFIESSPAYLTVENGISRSGLSTWKKEFLNLLAENNLGVFTTPYKHQIDALEATSDGKDLFVATGTGSGKTECFMWPLMLKLAEEARENKESWARRGVRVIVMYPMNALVSDQVGRLRRLIGDPEDKFLNVFRRTCGDNARRPQFGMYTGRTPYPGPEPQKKGDKDLEATLSRMVIEDADEIEKEYLLYLQKSGRIPAKKDLKGFLNKLHNGQHYPDEDDAELITRFEMQQVTPDILITNYSMLEYMLLRPREKNIWNDTKKWLQANENNRLLFIIDEAHMYKGSSGGEVALLIRRLFEKLGIKREKTQFILTTASMPDDSEDDRNSALQFACDLTATDVTHEFCYLTGERETIEEKNSISVDSSIINDYEPILFENQDTCLSTLNDFWNRICPDFSAFQSEEEIQNWMFENIINFQPFSRLLQKCRGSAVSLNELSEYIFPDLDHESALKAVSVLLAVAPMAKSKSGSVLFPARMHMLFRGINGIYSCMNPDCSHGHHDDSLSLGELFLSDGQLICPHCGSVVYELYNDRRCGALFAKAYILESEFTSLGRAYLWRYSGQLLDQRMKEIHLYIPENDYHLPARQGKNKIQPCYLDLKSGFLYMNDDSVEGREGYRKLYYCNYSQKGRPQIITFSTCPHCRHQFTSTQLTSFSTRGNASFYNLIKTQFDIQPPVRGKDNDPERLPNQGRKVLLFSDSRQRAARLARDMSDMSDAAAARQLFALAINEMEKSDVERSLNSIYDYYCLVSGQKHVQMFHGEERTKFNKDCKDAVNNFNRSLKRGNSYRPRQTIDNSPNKMKELLLRIFSGPYNTLYDSAVAWLEPTDEVLNDIIYELEERGVEVDDSKVLELFNAWLIRMNDLYLPLGQTIPDEVRLEVKDNFNGFGLPVNWSFPKVIKDIMGWNDDSTEMMAFQAAFEEMILDKGQFSPDKLYIDLSRIKPRFDLQHKWYRCETCSEITPYLLKCNCPSCGSEKIHKMTENEIASLDFWRVPIEGALSGEKINILDTEEHTAQVSFKDQRDDMWSKTEKYELRFQDLISENETPVDILSSTTTMEVGIDIGSLVAVGLRNIPPMRENYQQRAGRAGRRGATLSTIVTYCENGPHDTLYFNNPVPMFRGEPRRPWIDVRSEKLIQRHLSIVVLEKYMETIHSSLDDIAAADFLDNYYDDFRSYLENYDWENESVLYPDNTVFSRGNFKDAFICELDGLKLKRIAHPELYGVLETEEYSVNAKSMLDALYEEGIIPTYSFPKNVVSMYISNSNGRVEYQIQRGLDVAVSEYAPGRGIVVDKKTYQIGGLYYPGSERKKNMASSPARTYIDDPNFSKHLLKCPECGWFGLETESDGTCPFCGNENVSVARDMIRPWGFAPRDAKEIPSAQLEEEYTAVIPPLYSTVSAADEIEQVKDTKNIRVSTRSNQRIIMLNTGYSDTGFMICPDCGAAIPGNQIENLKKIGRPYRSQFARTKCNHAEARNVNLGYDFITDMLVLEFYIDSDVLDGRRNNLWLDQASISLAEALRLAVCKRLDVDFTELVTGSRYRQNKSGSFIDIYLYDSLSSGAGYAVSIKDSINEVLQDVYTLLSDCDCNGACYNCLKHYRNQFVHGYLNRHSALELLNWGVHGIKPEPLDVAEQAGLIEPLRNILAESGYSVTITNNSIVVEKSASKKQIIVYPAIWKEPKAKGMIYVSDILLKYAKPYALEKIISGFSK